VQHPLDPSAPYRACSLLGRLLAEGALSRAECLAALAEAAQGSAVDGSGLRARLVQSLLDQARDWHIARVGAVARARRALRAAVAAGEGREALLAVAGRADPYGALRPREREALAAAAVREWLQAGPGRRTRAAGIARSGFGAASTPRGTPDPA